MLQELVDLKLETSSLLGYILLCVFGGGGGGGGYQWHKWHNGELAKKNSIYAMKFYAI